MCAERIRRALAAAAACGGLAALAGCPASSAADGGRTPAAWAPSASQSLIYAGPPVEYMIVGAGNVILQPAQVTSVPALTVATSHGSCGIAAGLPLGPLVSLARGKHISFSLHDYGHCTASPASSGQLFVDSIDGETNHGQNGWEYKVDGRSGTAGAADPSGPFGNGRRLQPYDRLLWFWCQSFGGGCQRTLEVRAPKSVRRGASFSVSILGDDNYGRARAMSGARVSAGVIGNPSASAVTGTSGRVTFRAPSSSTLLTVKASRPGSVPAFPVSVQVR